MYIARILYPVEVLGPGKRIGIWFAGCHHHCKGCSNPELWEQPEKYRVSADTVMTLVNSIAEQHQVDGFTLTGGDPMEQADELPPLLERLSKISNDILMYGRQNHCPYCFTHLATVFASVPYSCAIWYMLAPD